MSRHDLRISQQRREMALTQATHLCLRGLLPFGDYFITGFIRNQDWQKVFKNLNYRCISPCPSLKWITITICTIIIAIYVSILILIVEMSKIDWNIASSAWWATTHDQCRLSSTSSSPSMDTFDQVVDGCWCFRYSLSIDESLLTELGLPTFYPYQFLLRRRGVVPISIVNSAQAGAAYPVYGLLPPPHFLTWLE